MNSACDNEERTDRDHESHIIDSGVNDARGPLNNQEIIQTNYAGESNAKLVVMTLPMTLGDERSECDRHQQDHKRHHDRPVRKCRGETQNRNHVAIRLIAVRSVNETRLCGASRTSRKGRAGVAYRPCFDGISCKCAATSAPISEGNSAYPA